MRDFLSNSGGTLPGIVQLTIKGKPWLEKTTGTNQWLFWFLTHESAHLWNSQLVKKAGGIHAWLHEGSADTWAYKSLMEFGIMSEKQYKKNIKNEKKDCLSGISKGFPLVDSRKERKFNNYYSCGHMINLYVEKTLKDKNMDIFDFWRVLLNEERDKDGQYTDKDFFDLWQKFYSNKSDIEKVKDLVYKNSKNAAKLFNEI